MNLNAIKKKFKDEGLIKSSGYYFNRAISKLSMHVVGRIAASHGQARKTRIVFKNREMLDFTDNPRALFEYLVEKGYNEKYQIIYMVSRKKNFRDRHYKNVKFVTAESPGGFSSPAAFYYGATAGYFFYSHNSADLNRFHQKGQLTVNLWHGCGYKGASLDNKNIPHSATMSAFDYCLVPGQVFAKSKAEGWNWPKEKILCMGYPRYDWLLDPGNNRSEILKSLGLQISSDTKVVIWMPTFRKSVLTGYGENEISLPYQLPGITDPGQMAQLDAHCGKENILLLIKKHPLQTGWKQENSYKNIRYVTDDLLASADIMLYRLLGVCDGLISDYSSVAVDYMLLERPTAFVLTDLPDYEQLRGFVFKNPLAYMPGEKVYDFEQLLAFLTHVREGRDLFAEQRKQLLLVMHEPCKDYRRRLLDFLNIEK